MKAFIFSLCIVLLMFSCKSSQSSVNESQQAKITSEQVIKATGTIVTKDSVFEKKIDKSISKDSTHKKAVDVFLSAPDSLGKQYVIHVLYTFSDNINSTLSDVSLIKGGVLNNSEQYSRDDQTTSNTSIDQQKSTQAKTKSDFKVPLIILSIILSSGILVLIFFVLKRFKII